MNQSSIKVMIIMTICGFRDLARNEFRPDQSCSNDAPESGVPT